MIFHQERKFFFSMMLEINFWNLLEEKKIIFKFYSTRGEKFKWLLKCFFMLTVESWMRAEKAKLFWKINSAREKVFNEFTLEKEKKNWHKRHKVFQFYYDCCKLSLSLFMKNIYVEDRDLIFDVHTKNLSSLLADQSHKFQLNRTQLIHLC